jgi:hypothetical protein
MAKYVCFTGDLLFEVNNSNQIAFMACVQNPFLKVNRSTSYGCEIVEFSAPSPDDDFYKKAETNVTSHPRGDVWIFDLLTKQFIKRISGHPKFGIFGNFMPNILKVPGMITAYALRKENGECGRIGAFEKDGTIFAVIGSKHVHVLARVDSAANFCADIERYKPDPALNKSDRYMVARKIATACFDTLPDIKGLVGHLSKQNYALSFEICFADQQHIVDYMSPNPLIFFFGITSASIPFGRLPPMQGITELKRLGLTCINEIQMFEGSVDEMKQWSKKIIVNDQITEGNVVTVCSPCGLLYSFKEKSREYSMQRKMRESMRCNDGIEMFWEKLSEFNVTGPEFEEAVSFYAYYLSRKFATLEFFEQWVTERKLYATLTAQQRNELTREYIRKQPNKQFVFILQGLPGSGKKTIGTAISDSYCQQYPDSSRFLRYLDDEKKFVTDLKELLATASIQYIFLSIPGVNPADRNFVTQILKKVSIRGAAVRLIVIDCPNKLSILDRIDRPAMIPWCLERKSSQGHVLNEKFLSNKYINQWDMRDESTITLDFFTPIDDQISTCRSLISLSIQR